MYSKFTTLLKLLVELKSFKIFTKLIEIKALGVLWQSAAASGVAHRRLSAPGAALFEFGIYLKLVFEVQGSIPSRLEGFLNFSIKSSKELTLREQRTLAQLLLIVLVVVDLLELQITGLYCACTWTVLPTYLGCTINPLVLVLHFKIKLF